MATIEDFRNGTDLVFVDISAEVRRTYRFPDANVVTIYNPLLLNVSNSGGHRIYDALGKCHYIPSG